ncbi:SDR family oxidoreductase [Methylobacillus gramineus]|uniref:SDR family NAD(P)-dependent oxidoreductase n=1 Tax=Methylobacillus gramineus TaxID=755169 RepID=UPI001CFF617B|nr:SDR family oxidoreductase [Methylobacillus gramineus]MCB5185811.1 SDR family oxidoreductase [Methylobacillus gramineus]
MSVVQDPFSLSGKRVLVTGASSGIGRQIAITCSQMGAQVVISGRNPERLQATAAALHGEGHIAITADLSQQEGIDQLVAVSDTLHGVVHAAGISKLVPFRLINKQHLTDIFDSNTFAPMLLTRGLLAKKRIAQNGSILFISALSSHSGALATSAYAASKSALLGAMRSLALEIAKQGMRVNCIAPGYVHTPMLDGLGQGGGNMDALFDLTPLGMGEPEDVAYASVFYLADASRWITRNYFILDGGLSTPMDIYA